MAGVHAGKTAESGSCGSNLPDILVGVNTGQENKKEKEKEKDPECPEVISTCRPSLSATARHLLPLKSSHQAFGFLIASILRLPHPPLPKSAAASPTHHLLPTRVSQGFPPKLSCTTKVLNFSSSFGYQDLSDNMLLFQISNEGFMVNQHSISVTNPLHEPQPPLMVKQDLS